MRRREVHRSLRVVAEAQNALPALTLVGAGQDDGDLAERVRRGDEAAFEVVFRTHVQALYTFAISYVRSKAIAEELVQDVFARVWMGRATWVVRDGIRPYLFGAVRNGALRYVGRERMASRVVTQAVADHAVADHAVLGTGRLAPPPDEATEHKEWNAALEQAVADLPERRRAAFLMRWQQGHSNAEIAQKMGISVKGVEMALVHALKTLRQKLSAF